MNKKMGFTLIELVMVILLLAILGAITIPNFVDFRTDARNGSTNGGLGSLRSSISIATAAIALKEDPSQPKYPTYAELSGNKLLAASHPVLGALNTPILDPSAGIPKNPWTVATAAVADHNKIYDCSAIAKGALLAAPDDDRGWCYKAATGEIWANSDKNGGPTTENNF